MKNLVIGIFLTSLALFSFGDKASAVQNNRSVVEPVMIIRFSKPQVNYDRQLYSVVKKVLEIKDTTQFDIISHVGDRANFRGKNKEVADTLKEMGVDPRQIRLGKTSKPNLKWEEVFIYVK